MVQSSELSKTISVVTGYIRPIHFANKKTEYDVLTQDARYVVLGVNLENTNNVTSGTLFSSSTPYAEGRISNTVTKDLPAGTVVVRANVHDCVDAVVPQNPKKPNILFVLADDLDMQTMTQLPKLKSLMADKGMTFENSFVSLSLCCPSRAATLCGQYAHNNGVFTNEDNNGDGTNGALTGFLKAGDEKNTMAVWLQNAGYRTALMGKYLNGYDSDKGVGTTVPPGWSEWAVPVDGNPYTQYNYTLNVNGTKEKHYLPYCTSQGKGPNCAAPNSANTSTLANREEHFMMNVLEKKAADLITRSSKDGTPFFLYLAPYAPHSPATPAPSDEKIITDTSWLTSHPLPKSASFNEADISDKPTWLRNYGDNLLDGGDIADITDMYHKRIISMYAVEDMLAHLIETLDKNGQLENTYIVFMSDNGYHLGQHRLEAGKLTEFDTDLRIPLIIRGPKVPAGSKSTQLTANVDIAPTFLSLANLAIPKSVDGRSFKETLLGGTSAPRAALLLEHANPVVKAKGAQSVVANTNEISAETPRQLKKPSKAEFVGEYRGIRTAQYTYIHYTKDNEEELYDNVNDPEQLNNVVSVAKASFLTRLRNWTADLATCVGEQCRILESQTRLDGVKDTLDDKVCFIGGQQIYNGDSVTLYKNRVVEAGQSCDAIKQVRTCVDGKLSGDATYAVDTCSPLERFTGINLNRNPENLDMRLLNETGATWMRASADVIEYFNASTTKQFASDWKGFTTAHQVNGIKTVVSLWWDFSDRGEFLPAPDSPREKELFKFLDTTFLPNLIPMANIIVSGNEPFINSTSSDLKYDATKKYAPVANFYERVTKHIADYMAASSTLKQSKPKLYMGAFTRLYSDNVIHGDEGYAIDHMLKFANNASYIDGVDIHTHVGELGVSQITDSLDFVTSYTKKPILDTEYSYVHKQFAHIDEKLNDSDLNNLSRINENGILVNNLSFLQKYPQYPASTTGISYMAVAGGSGSTTKPKPVTKTEWDDFYKSRSWTIDHFIKGADAIFKSKKYNVNGVNYSFSSQGKAGSRFFVSDYSLPWFMTGLYVGNTVQYLPPTPLFPEGKRQGNYQDLNDFQIINHVPVTQ